ncbi:GlsB/YeaQ/YmgE family stress response membrane protein [Companilactobacillus sp. FL22-1]|uniref:GlsB/YeaQ/YmgE family stress response membrane protein n=1 Tax=Companilactobacillus sp. FL22-1 TaxID=3373892 RepID=UPI003754CE89
MLHAIWVLIIGGVIGAVASMIVNRNMPMGWVGNIIGGLLGAWLGESLLGTWGPDVAGMAIFPAIVGSLIVVLLISWALNSFKRAS